MSVRINLTCVCTSPQQIAGMLFGLQRASQANLREVNLPPLYRSGVRYKEEPIGRERWQLPSETYSRGEGDCEDLAAWRAAELVVSGEDTRARAILRWLRPGLMHCLVLRSGGKTEDPSKVLGMNGDG